jgi:hypothetical protein
MKILKHAIAMKILKHAIAMKMLRLSDHVRYQHAHSQFRQVGNALVLIIVLQSHIECILHSNNKASGKQGGSRATRSLCTC